MKKNLLALVVLLVLVAVVAQFTRQAGKKPEWVALEKDMVASLELLWQQPGQSVEILEVDGPCAEVVVSMPPQSCAAWNYALLDLVAARHPAVQLQSIFINDRPSGLRIFPERLPGVSTPHSKLLRRQVQAKLDANGRDRAVALVDVREVAPTPIAPVEMRIQRGVEAPPGRSRRANSGKAFLQATPAPVPQIQIHACLVLLPEVSSEEIDQAVKSLNLVPERGDQVRLVKLPPL